MRPPATRHAQEGGLHMRGTGIVCAILLSGGVALAQVKQDDNSGFFDKPGGLVTYVTLTNGDARVDVDSFGRAGHGPGQPGNGFGVRYDTTFNPSAVYQHYDFISTGGAVG